MRTSELGVIVFRIIRGDGGDPDPCYGSVRGPHYYSDLGKFRFMYRDIFYA